MKPLEREIVCPASETGEKKIVYTYYTYHKGKFFPFPCQGCDDMTGSKICEKCTADVTRDYFNNPPSGNKFFIHPLHRPEYSEDSEHTQD